MTIIYVFAALFLAGLAVLGLGCWLGHRSKGDGYYGMWDGQWVATAAAGGVLTAAFGLFLLILPLSYYADKANCRGYAHATSRPTRFRVTSGWGQWDCFTPAHDGRWVPTDKIGDYNK